MKIESIRQIFLPEPGQLVVKIDLSQAEDRTAKMECDSDELAEQANRKPWLFDVHTHNAKMILKKQEVTKEERTLCKFVVHGAWRDMGPPKLAENVLVNTGGDLVLSISEASKMLNEFLEEMPMIRNYYMPKIRQIIDTEGVLENTFGRRWDVRYHQKTPDLYRKAYSYLPQSNVADWMNQFGLLPCYDWTMSKYGVPPLLQKHDEMIASVAPQDLWEFCNFMTKSLERTIEMPPGSGRYLSIPADIEISDTFHGGIEFSPLPETETIFYAKLEPLFSGEWNSWDKAAKKAWLKQFENEEI